MKKITVWIVIGKTVNISVHDEDYISAEKMNHGKPLPAGAWYDQTLQWFLGRLLRVNLITLEGV